MRFEDGRETEEIYEMEGIAGSYFQNLFSTGRRGNYKHLLTGINRCIFEEDNSWLMASYTKEEIRVALSELGPTKAPEEDGFLTLFYQKCWSIMGDDMSSFCLQHLNGGMDISLTNKTNILLIPKIPNPSNINHFRPISLCNVLYKLMAKVIANRLHVVINKCINLAQSAFVPERLISDNVLLAYEILHALKQQKMGKK
ncbi:reverse transcriptase [Gossypium australe]|uniref:Reverse transcriptase n=1 Tax=Gossypium australe TaxID=47621 RepID=A0A5B6WZ85_9ROSI|nr:reverse transcriptase [Gossypium australe]